MQVIGYSIAGRLIMEWAAQWCCPDWHSRDHTKVHRWTKP